MVVCTVSWLCNSVVEQLGGKQLVMTHLSHEDPNVRYEALLAVQKLMVHNWYAACQVFVWLVLSKIHFKIYIQNTCEICV